MATKKKTKKKPAKKAAAPKKKLAKKKATPKKKVVGKTKRAAKKRVRGKSQTVDTVAYAPEGLGARSGGQSGDLQGLSNLAGPTSERLDEFLEAGNAFEAPVLKGVPDPAEQ